MQPFRTATEIAVKIKFWALDRLSLYQKLGKKVMELRHLAMINELSLPCRCRGWRNKAREAAREIRLIDLLNF